MNQPKKSSSMFKIVVVLLALLAAAALVTNPGLIGLSGKDAQMSFIMCGGEVREADQKVIDQFQEDNPGVMVDMQAIPWGECQDKATTLAATGDPVSIAYMGSRTLKQLAKNGLIVPVEISPEVQPLYQPGVLDTVKSDGKFWGFPHAFSTKVLFVNCDILAQAELECEGPRTWDELYSMAQTVKEMTGVAGIGLVAKDFDNTMHQYLNYLYSNGGQVIDPVSGEITFDSPASVETLEFYAKLAEVAQDGPTAFERSQVKDLFNDGKVAMYIDGPWARGQHNLENTKHFRLPAGPRGKSGTLRITDSIAVFSNTGHEELAVKLAQALASGDAQYDLDSSWGLTPIMKYDKLVNNPYYVEDSAYWEPFVAAIGDGGPEPLFVEYKQLQTAFNEMIQAAVLGDTDYEGLVAQTATKLEELK